METKDNRQIALQKAISSHEQAAAGLTDLVNMLPEDRYRAMLLRIEQNIADLQSSAESEQKPEGG